LYLVSSDTTLDGNGITALYQKRWNVEPYHKSLKQNTSLEKSPTQTVTTQSNHFFAALCGYIKLELLKGDTRFASITLRSSPNCTCMPFIPRMPLYVNSTLLAWLRKVS